MIISYNLNAQNQTDDSEDIPYDLSYDDMDTLVRTCGGILPESDAKDPESIRRPMSFV